MSKQSEDQSEEAEERTKPIVLSGTSLGSIKMSQYAALKSLFVDDDLSFCQEQLLRPLSLLQQDFLSRRAKLAESLHNSSQLLTLRQHPVLSSTLPRLSNGINQKRETASMEWQEDPQQASDTNSDFLVTLDARGYAPGDITVRLEGRSLAIVAVKQEEESQYCSSSSSSASSSSASSQMGFVQKIDLPVYVDLSGLSCSLMHDGQLQIYAPVSKQPINKESQVPRRYRTSLEFTIRKDN